MLEVNGHYMTLKEQELLPHHKTPTYIITEIGNGNILGGIHWYSPWRRFCFYPNSCTVFDAECTKQISDWLKLLNDSINKARKRNNME